MLGRRAIISHIKSRLNSNCRGRFPYLKSLFPIQSGRSMTEMLCVLAVIGVLSLGAYASIRFGLAKAQANKIAYSVNLQATAFLITLEADALPLDDNNSLTVSYNKTENGYPLSAFSNDGKNFGITVNNVPEDICHQAGNTLPERAFGLVINAENNQIPNQESIKVSGICSKKNNTLTYYFAKLDADSMETLDECNGVVCPVCQTCQKGTCVLVSAGTPDPSGNCPGTSPVCTADGNCVCSHESCGEGKVCDATSNICIDCPSFVSQLSQELCEACGNTVYSSGNCFACPTAEEGHYYTAAADGRTCDNCEELCGMCKNSVSQYGGRMCLYKRNGI